tara:strand:+ start:642 stop:854 length:213 start_codon:yes stop_codon:yes gene_type:complete
MKKLSFNQQIELQEKMQNKGLNLVTCCNCDAVIIHTRKQVEMQVECYSCKKEININECQDYFYDGMPEQE